MQSDEAIATAAHILIRAHAEQASLVAFERCRELFAADDQEAAFAMIDVVMAIKQMSAWFGANLGPLLDLGPI